MRSRVRIVLAVAALAVGLLPAAPALAACATHNHNTWYNEGSWYSSTWQTKPSGDNLQRHQHLLGQPLW